MAIEDPAVFPRGTASGRTDVPAFRHHTHRVLPLLLPELLIARGSLASAARIHEHGLIAVDRRKDSGEALYLLNVVDDDVRPVKGILRIQIAAAGMAGN